MRNWTWSWDSVVCRNQEREGKMCGTHIWKDKWDWNRTDEELELVTARSGNCWWHWHKEEAKLSEQLARNSWPITIKQK